VGAAAAALVPNAARRRVEYYRHLRSAGLPWLRGAARDAYARAVADLSCSPLRWDRETLDLLTRRTTVVALHNFDAQAREFSLAPVHPLADARFRFALAAAGGAWGYAGRTDLMRRLFGDLLPDAVLSRRTKAAFNLSRWGERERAFARAWDGSGVDRRLVDPEALRTSWLADRPTSVEGFYLHLAWLAQEGLEPSGRPRP
jgi:asparagine synthase (glutamine-hydrolysing)